MRCDELRCGAVRCDAMRASAGSQLTPPLNPTLLHTTAASRGNRSHFQAAEFMREHENNTFVAKLLHSQSFERFLEDRLTALRAEKKAKASKRGDGFKPPAEMVFFDESIVAKMNRNAISLFSGEKSTPFLDDDSLAIREVYQPPTADTRGLPVRLGRRGWGEERERLSNRYNTQALSKTHHCQSTHAARLPVEVQEGRLSSAPEKSLWQDQERSGIAR